MVPRDRYQIVNPLLEGTNVFTSLALVNNKPPIAVSTEGLRGIDFELEEEQEKVLEVLVELLSLV